MSDKKENNSNEPTKAETAKTAAMLWNLILLCMGSLTIKTAWNLSVRRLFPSMPQMYFLDGVGLLLIVYTVARAASIGFMSEAARTVARGLENFAEALESLPETLGLKNIKFNVRNSEESENNSDLN